MKYFEFNEPHYALIRAKDKIIACETFETIIASGSFKFIEKTRNEALNLFLINEDAKGERDFSDMMMEFNEDKEAILLVDRGIL